MKIQVTEKSKTQYLCYLSCAQIEVGEAGNTVIEAIRKAHAVWLNKYFIKHKQNDRS